jgi:hypothetical protein
MCKVQQLATHFRRNVFPGPGIGIAGMNHGNNYFPTSSKTHEYQKSSKVLASCLSLTK